MPPNEPMQINTSFPPEMKGGFSAAVPDKLYPSFFEVVSNFLASELIKLLGPTWARKRIPSVCCESVIAPIFTNDDRSSCRTHRKIWYSRWAYAQVGFGIEQVVLIIYRC